MPSEASGPTAFSKCCAKGRVKEEQRFRALQDRPDELVLILAAPVNAQRRKQLFKKIIYYNDNLSFGRLHIQRDKDFDQQYRIVKCNNQITYMVWDYNSPLGRPEARGQLFTLNADEANIRLAEIATEYQLDVRLIILP